MPFRIVPVSSDHVAEITAIYAKAVRETLVTWDETAPDEVAMAAKLQAIQSAGYPCLVAIDDATGAVAGYALASAFHPQSGFRFSAENSIYVAEHARRRGIGRRLLDALINECIARGFRQMIAGISRPGGEASLALHEAAGFKVCGVLPSVGWKMGQWLDAVYLVRPLGDGNSTGPE